MSDAKQKTIVSIEGTDVVVDGDAITKHRGARLFFLGILGAIETQTGWRCASRNVDAKELLLKAYDWLIARGFEVQVEGQSHQVVDRELERRRSFRRAKEAASAFKSGRATAVSPDILLGALNEIGWSEERDLYEHQLNGALHALTAINAANFSVPGSGKTIITLAVAAVHLANDTIDLVVVVGPLASFEPWEREGLAALEGFVSTRRVRGNRGDRQLAYNSTRPREILLLSYPTAAADQILLLDLFQRYRVMLVVDESHRIKRFRGGYWAPALLEVAKKARVRMILSGTPMPQSGRDLYTQLNILWPGGELTGSRDAFADRVDRNFSAVLSDVSPFVARTPKSDLNLPPYTVHRHEVPLSGTQSEIYALIENRLRRAVEGAAAWHEKIEALRRARPIRLLQAATNPDVLNVNDNYYSLNSLDTEGSGIMARLARYGEEEVPAKSRKAVRIIRELADRDEKVVCWSNFVPNLDAFSALVRSETGLPTFQIDGRVPAGTDALRESADNERPREGETREDVIERFLSWDGPSVLVTNPASCSESISLHRTCHNAIYIDRTYDAALFLQSIDRIHRLGLPPEARVDVHILLASQFSGDTIDHLVDAALRRKEANMLRLLEGAELMPLGLHDDPAQDAEGDEEDLASLLRYLIGEEV